LIKEHLTEYIELPSPTYTLASVGGIDRIGWNVPTAGVSRGCNEFGGNFVVKLQPFEAGGFELSCRSLDLERIGAAMKTSTRQRKGQSAKSGI
jgi:hypothetical protein